MRRAKNLINKYRVVISELQSGTIYYDSEERKVASSEGRSLPDIFEEWVETEDLSSHSSKVIAGFLRAKADELDPQEEKKSTLRGFDA